MGRDPEDGAKRYRQILPTVIGTIKRHGNRGKIERFSAYFLWCVQEHLKHHGEEYYNAAKEVRSLAAMLPRTLQGIHSGTAPDTFLDVLAAANQMVKSKGGRKKTARAAEPDLFAH